MRYKLHIYFIYSIFIYFIEIYKNIAIIKKINVSKNKKGQFFKIQKLRSTLILNN